MPSDSQPVQPPIPVVAFLLPFAVLAVAAFARRNDATARTWSVLAVGFIVLLVLVAVGPLQAGDPSERYPKARCVALLAIFGIMLLFSMSCAWIAVAGRDGPTNVWPAIVPLPAWFLFSLLIPLWTDSPVVRTDQPETGWKTIGVYRLLYSDPDEAALWVYMQPQSYRDASRSVRYTPNLGHHWGRMVMTTFVVLILAMLAMLIAASRPDGLVP